MPDNQIFCNTPWYELHIYWDGSLGICCQEDHKLYSGSQWNIANTTIVDWFNSEPVRKFRLEMLGTSRSSACRRCYIDQDLGGHSRRLNSLQKSVIFAKQAFEASYYQSPGYQHFEHSRLNHGWTNTVPIDLHVDLGNFCNLACKMCEPRASSVIAAQQVKWGIESSRKYLGQDWTQNTQVWQSFIDQILAIDKLQNIHFMGGETLLTDRVDNLVDQFIAAGKFDVCFSFVTNGTVFRSKLMDKLKLFKRVGIEVSIETTDCHNAYQRQGTDTEVVLHNIQQYIGISNNSSITVSLRPAPSALTVGYYWTLLDFALKQKLIVKSNLCFSPAFMHAKVLPKAVRQQYAQQYQRFLLPSAGSHDFNASDPHNYQTVIAIQAQQIINLLSLPEPQDLAHLQAQLVEHCKRWDKVYGLDARTLYPELIELWDSNGY